MIFDASVLLAFLLAEPGSDKIASKLSDGLISSVNWSEIIGHFARNGVSQPDIQHVLGFLPIKQIIPFDETQASIAGMLLPATRSIGLSLGDRACLALAKHLKKPAYTADRAWLEIAPIIDVEIKLIR